MIEEGPLCTDESTASPDGPDSLAEGRLFNGNNCPVRIKRQPGGGVRGGGVFWFGMIGNMLIELFRVAEVQYILLLHELYHAR